MHKFTRAAASFVAASALAVTTGVATAPSASAEPTGGPSVPAFSVADEKAFLRQQAIESRQAARSEAGLRAAAPVAAGSSGKRTKGQRALAFARRQIGDRYAYGGNGPRSWDCSGLTRGAWKAAGVKLPHNSRAQYRRGKKVARKNLRKGDLVFFYSGISHVGIYAGNGKIIHASRPGKPVGYIKIKYMPYKGARRPG